MTKTAYLAPVGLEGELRQELKNVTQVHERLFVTEGPPQRTLWAQNIWYDAQIAQIDSIGDAAKKLRAIQRNWWPYATSHHRRMKFIQEKLPHLAPKPLEFLSEVPKSPLGSWTLLDDNTILYSSHCLSPMPNGEWNFVEDKVNPPSRAYLKLWELFTRTGVYPTKNDICFDLGASPGGWTWVLSKLANHVFSFDRSPLEPRISALPNITFLKQDAFKVDLAAYANATWVLSDVVCYPEKLFKHVSELVNRYPDKKYVFTIKFQGLSQPKVLDDFASLPGHVVHLCQNKHELTWYCV